MRVALFLPWLLSSCGASSRHEEIGRPDAGSGADDAGAHPDAGDPGAECGDLGEAAVAASLACCELEDGMAEEYGAGLETWCREPIGSGRMRVDPELESRCFDALYGAWARCEYFDVTSWNGEPNPCADYRIGLQELGDPCDRPEECRDGLYCFDGTCVDVAAEGDPCDYYVPCAEGLLCYPNRHVCDEPPSRGESCLDGNTVVECADGFFCEQSGHLCISRRAEGGACGSSIECAEGLYCLDHGTCERLHAKGETCVNERECADDMRCASESSTCAPRLPDGAACETALDCESDHCGYEDGVCSTEPSYLCGTFWG